MTDVKQLITEHLDIWLTAETEKKSGRGRSSGSNDTIYGVQKLRELIINFALTGKLVKNISTEISAFELLKKIMEDKKQKLKEGKIKKSNKKYIQPESDIKVPLGWEITIINNLIFDMDAGWSPACLAEPANQTQWGVLKTTAVQANSFLCFENKCLPENLTPKKEYEVQVGDILVTRAGPYNRVGIACYVEDVRPKLMISDKLIRLKYNSSYINGKFFALSINFGPTSAYLKENQSGMAESQVNISQDKLRSALISIPPLEEQQRIVAKVDELMQLCDQLEQQQTLSSDAHATLVDTLLKALIESNDADEFQDNWQRIVANFDLLFTTEYSIEQLKQTVLQLAVMGKLVKQDPSDEPASELLKKIADEKAKLIKEGKIKKSKPLPEIDPTRVPFEIPENWAWARFSELGEFGRGKSKHRPRNDPALFNPPIYPLIQTGEVARAKNIIREYHSKYSEIGLAQSRMWSEGTLCITIAANIADTAILGFDACFPDSVVGFVPVKPLDSARYLLFFMKTAREQLLAYAPATAQKNINLEILESVYIPIPPLNEQNKIIEKVDSIIAIIDALKVAQSKLQQTKLHLADALVANAVEGV